MSERRCRSRRSGWPVLLLISLLLAAGASLASGRDSKPRLAVPETTHDFGDVFVGQYMYHVFAIRNEGALPLTLSDDAPTKPPVRPSPPAAPPAAVYNSPHVGANPNLDALAAGEAFRVRRYPACGFVGALVARGGRSAAWHTPPEGANATPATFAASPPAEPVPT